MTITSNPKFLKTRLYLLVIVLSVVVIGTLGFFVFFRQNNERPIVFCNYQDPDVTGSKRAGGLYTIQLNEGEATVTFITDAQIAFRYFALGHPSVVALSPTGLYVAYNNSDGKAYLVDLATQKQRELVAVSEDPLRIVWSTDGKQVAIETTRRRDAFLGLLNSTWNIFDMHSSSAHFTSGLSFVNPFYSWEEKGHVALDNSSPNGKWNLGYDEEQQLVIGRPKNQGGGSSVTIPGNFRFVEWSPDSKQLLLIIVETKEKSPDVERGFARAFRRLFSATLFVVNVDGTGLTQITNVGEADAFFRPTWSPDGKTILYGSWLKDTDGDGIADQELFYEALMAVDKDGSNRRELLDETYDVACLDW